ncbi:hypothetical protein ACNO5E_18710 [Vibrio parahaemolyticus]
MSVNNQNNGSQDSLSKGRMIGLSLFIAGGLVFIVNSFNPGLMKSVGSFVSSDAIANEQASIPSERATKKLAEKQAVAEEEAKAIVREEGGKIVYEDTIVPPPPSYQTTLKFDHIMATYNLVTRINKNGKENAYVFAGLKLDAANRRELLNVKQLEASELAIDERIAKSQAQIAKYKSGYIEDTTQSGSIVSASGNNASSESLTNVLLGGEGDTQIEQVAGEIDSIRLASVANSKAMIYINGRPYEGVRTGDTVNRRYEVLAINTNRQCIRLSDLKTEGRDELAPICIH